MAIYSLQGHFSGIAHSVPTQENFQGVPLLLTYRWGAWGSEKSSIALVPLPYVEKEQSMRKAGREDWMLQRSWFQVQTPVPFYSVLQLTNISARNRERCWGPKHEHMGSMPQEGWMPSSPLEIIKVSVTGCSPGRTVTRCEASDGCASYWTLRMQLLHVNPCRPHTGPCYEKRASKGRGQGQGMGLQRKKIRRVSSLRKA